VALCLVDRDLRYVEVNERMASLNRRPIAEHIGVTIRDVVPDIADLIEPVYRQVFATGRSVESSFVSEPIDGGERYVLVSYNPVKDEGGSVVLVSVAVFDVTAEKNARDAADAFARQLKEVLESTSDNVILLSADWRITYVNGRAARLFAPRPLTVGQSLSQVFPGWEGSKIGQRLVAIGAKRGAETLEAYFEGLGRWLELDIFPTSDGVSVFFRDVSDRRLAAETERHNQEKIAYMASHDSLTGLANRTAFHDQLEKRLGTRAPQAQVALLYLDLDGFKAVNDTMGHPAGDIVLVAVAERLRQCAAAFERSLLSRFGGDEFVIVISDPASRSESCALAERIVTALSRGFDVEDQRVLIGVSIGISEASEGVSVDELLARADLALYAAKANGRGSYRYFEPGMETERLQRRASASFNKGALR
jgi:diguanylate cyclase (GGDEF)-like protein